MLKKGRPWTSTKSTESTRKARVPHTKPQASAADSSHPDQWAQRLGDDAFDVVRRGAQLDDFPDHPRWQANPVRTDLGDHHQLDR